MKPLNTQILVEFEEKVEKKTEAGLYVPTTSENEHASGCLRKAKVIAVNPTEEYIKEGQTILFNRHAGNFIPGSTTQKLVRSEDIYAIL